MEWFRAIENKTLLNSLNLTLQNFTHQHRQVYLENQLILQKASFEIDEKVIEKIKNCRKSSLSLDGNSWSKK